MSGNGSRRSANDGPSSALSDFRGARVPLAKITECVLINQQ